MPERTRPALENLPATPMGAPGPPPPGTEPDGGDRTPGGAEPAELRYRRKTAEYEAEEARLGTLSRRISWARFAAFLGAVAAVLRGEALDPGARAPWFLLGLLLAAGFLLLMFLHRRIRRRETHAATLAALSREGGWRVRRAWGELPADPSPPAPRDHPFAADLDLLGRGSLMQLVGPPSTEPGRSTLRRWFLAPAPPEEGRARQEAIRELAPREELRDEIQARGRSLPSAPSGDLGAFLAWAEGAPWLPEERLLAAAALVLPPVTGVLGVLHLTGTLPGLWALPMAAGYFLLLTRIREIHRRFDQAGAGEAEVRRFEPILELLEGERWQASSLTALGDRLAGGEISARDAIRRLRKILDWGELRRSMFGFVSQLLFMGDVHVLRAMERWQRRYGREVRGWVEALGELEALSALAGLARDHPHWGFPELVDSPGPTPQLEARGLGHPLLPPERCVRNDVTLGPPGTVLLVTGSNMSGKSTLLRAIGVNAVLGGAGAPVCATHLRLPPLQLATSMRIHDSLQEGVSLFMAELQRLRQVVELGRQVAEDDGRMLLYLLDEILQGTNSEERQVAARRIVAHLLDAGAIGAVTTHDLTLAATPELVGPAIPVHFRETVHPAGEGPLLTFDYRLRPGLATSRNALRLMEVVGLGEGEPPV